MEYVSKISLDKQRIICDFIGGASFKNLFINNSKEFNKIKPGFRVNTLTNDSALETAKKTINISSGIVRDYVDAWLKDYVSDIKKQVEDLESQGEMHSKAIMLSLIDSFFENDIELFFQLYDENITKEEILFIKEEISKEKQIRSEKSNAHIRIKELEDKIKKLEEKIEENQIEYNNIYSEKQSVISNYKQEINELNKKLLDLTEQLQIVEEKNSANSFEITEYQQLMEFEDKVPIGIPKFDSEEIVSLCEVFVDYSGFIWLNRKADIDYSGKLSFYIKDESRPLLFDNRDKLIRKDGPGTAGDYSVWNWHTVPNNNDPSKDYVLTAHNPYISVIEIVILRDCTSLDELISVLKTGIEIEIHSNKIMFSILKSKGQYEGILLNSKEFINENGKIALSKSITLAPMYEFLSSQIIKFENDKMFFKTVFAGIPQKIIRLKSLIEVTKEVVLDSLSWANYKTRGMAKAEYKCFKDLISSIYSEDIVEKISTINHCSKNVASDLLNQFISKITNYINESSIEDEIIFSALNSNDTLMNRAKLLITDEWEKENCELLNKAQRELNDITERVNNANEELASIQDSYMKIKTECESFSLMMAEKEKLALDVETAVAEKIRNAQENVADFIANMDFIYAVTPYVEHNTLNSNYAVHSASYEVIKQSFDISNADEHHNWREVIDTVSLELEEAGVSSTYSMGLATYLCASFIAKEPQIIIGPNAKNIVEAFNISLFGNNLGLLKCEGGFDKSLLDNIGNSNEQIVMIDNILSKSWIERVPDIFSNQNTMFIATCPFAEDVQVESKSIYNYMLPLFTEFFVDKRASNNYCGGYFSDDFVSYNHERTVKRESKICSSLNANKLVKLKIQNIISIMYDINDNMTDNDEFVFGLLQYAYATLDREVINDIVDNNRISISNELKSELEFFIGES